MRKILSIILSVTLMLTFLPTGLFSITVSAATATGRCGDTAYWTINTSTGKLDITGTGQIGPYGTEYKYGPHARNVWGSSSYTYLENIKDVYIGEGITGIDTEMFFAHWNNGKPTYIKNLKSIHVPTTLKYIDSNAFYTIPDVYISDLSSWCLVDCKDNIGTLYLNDEAISGELVVPENVTKIGTGVFYNQQNITSVSVPSTVTAIGKNAFSNCANLKNATVSGNCPITSDCGLGNITTLTIRGDVSTVNNSFNNLKKVQEINIENGVQVLDSNAFDGCSKLTQISLPNSIKQICADAFNDCDNLTDIYFDGTILEWIDITKDGGNTALSSATIHCSEIADIADAVPNVSNVTYNSEEQCPTVTINGLTEDVDFTVEYSNNVNVGTANIIIKGINTCIGEQKITFEILPANISGATVSGITDKIFTNNKITQNIVVEMFDDVLSEGVDYTIDYANNTNAGEASIKINGIGNYCGVWNNSFNIGCKDISSAVVENIQDKTFDYQYFTQENISVTVDNILLGKDKDYTVSYKSNYYAGTASVIITGTGNYTGTLTKYFRINSRDINEVSISGVLSKEYDTTAQTQIPTLTYKGQKLNSSDYKITYTNNTDCGTATMTVTGKNNFIGSFSVEFEIAQADISDCSISGIVNKDYTGEEILQNSIYVYLNSKRLVENTHYTVKYTNNIEAGKAQVIITGIGNLKGTVTKEFSIKKTHPFAGTPTTVKVTINSIEVQYFEGMEYRIDNGNWQSSPIFNNLVEGTTYTIWQRWAETDTHKVNSFLSGISVTAQHTYDNGCDSNCNVCGYIRTDIRHTYYNDCDKDCNICGFVRTVPEHVYTDDCDNDCNICGYAITPKHYYNFKCSTICNKCGVVRKAAEHIYNNSCDTVCNVCCETRTIMHTHQIKNIWAFDKTYHWEKCYICGDETTKQTHTFSGDSDATCNTCGYTRLLETVTSQTHLTTVPKGYKGIYNYTDLLSINNNPSGKYILMADIDVSQCTLSVVINNEFTGVLNGNGYSIKNFKYEEVITKKMVVGGGIFLKNKGVICNLTIENLNIIVEIRNKETSAFIGAIAGDNSGIIRNCEIIQPQIFCTGNDTITVGGVAAANTKTGVIENCRVTGSYGLLGASYYYTDYSNADFYVGGISGTNYGKIRRSYCESGLSVNAAYISIVASICAVNNGEVLDCYSDGIILIHSTKTIYGAIVGYNQTSGLIKNTYCAGNTGYNGSFVGRHTVHKNDGTVQNSYTSFVYQESLVGFDFEDVWELNSKKLSLRPYNATVCIEGNAHTGGLNCCVASRICEVCGVVYGETGDHVYSQWYTVYDSTCSSNGLKIKNCLYCGVETIDEIALSNHNYDNSCDISCNVCDATRNITHTYTNSCDTSCNVCGHTRTIVHTYSNNCDSSCNVCGYTRTVGEHIYSNACDTTCNECGQTRATQHVYDNDADMICNICKYDRSIPTKITSSKHTITGNSISKITAGTTVASLLSGLNEGSYCKIYKGSSQVSGTTAVGTGMVVKIMDGNNVKASYTVIVTGDTNGDGNITITDMIAIKAHVLKKSTLSGVYATAADTNGDNGISITDFIQVKAKILGKGTITAR